MERFLLLWDELDDLVGLARHLGRNLGADAKRGMLGAFSALRQPRHLSWQQALKFRAPAPNLFRR